VKSLIIGKGIVGGALKNKIIDADIVDKDYTVLDICFSYSEKFVDTVVSYAKRYNPEIVIIHSTVLPGTTKKIYEKGIPVVYSPTIGRHDNLEIKSKLIASYEEEALQKAIEYFDEYGIEQWLYIESVEALELGKLLSTLYYGWCIAFEKEVYVLCEKLGIDFKQAYQKFNVYYNEQYRETNFVRPILKQKRGGIGGTCVIPNAELLKKFIPNILCQFLLERNKKWKSE